MYIYIVSCVEPLSHALSRYSYYNCIQLLLYDVNIINACLSFVVLYFYFIDFSVTIMAYSYLTITLNLCIHS